MTAVATPQPFVSRAPKLGFVAPLDGLRGFGIAVVVLGHASVDRIQGFATIIDCFFVLSGFLITTLLLQERRSTGGIDLRKFYSRRAVRLLPALWVNLVFWILVGVAAQLAGKDYLRDILKNAAASFLYVYHLFYPVGLELISEPATGREAERVLSPLWTLSLEEHFYILIPITIVVFVKRNRMLALAGVLAAIWAAVAVHRAVGYTGPFVSPGSPAVLRLFWLARPEALLLGTVLAIVNAHVPEEWTRRHQGRLLAVGSVAFVGWLLSMQTSHTLIRDHVSADLYWPYLPDNATLDSYGSGPADDQMYYFRFAHSLTQAIFAVVLLPMVRFPAWWASRLMSWKPLAWLGRLSYTLYIWHSVPIVVVKLVAPDLHWVLTTAVVGVLSVAISLPVYRWVELPVLKAKLRFSAEKEALDLRTGKMVRTDGGAPDGGAPDGGS